MKPRFGLALIALCTILSVAPERAVASSSARTLLASANDRATEFSSRHRQHVRHRGARQHRVIIATRPGAYYARPLRYSPYGVTPLFPFEPGYGLGPSW